MNNQTNQPSDTHKPLIECELGLLKDAIISLQDEFLKLSQRLKPVVLLPETKPIENKAKPIDPTGGPARARLPELGEIIRSNRYSIDDICNQIFELQRCLEV